MHGDKADGKWKDGMMYRNEHLKKLVKAEVINAAVSSALLLLIVSLCFSGFYLTYRELYHGPPIPFERLWADQEIVRSATITKMPERVYPSYYMVWVGDYAILMTNMEDSLRKMELRPSVTVSGVIRVLDEEDPAARAARAYYRAHELYTAQEQEDFSCYYLDCAGISFTKWLLEKHPASYAFSVPLLILLCLIESDHSIIRAWKHLHPVTGNSRCTIREIDEQASDPRSVWLGAYDVYITPELLISVRYGMTAVAFEEIREVYARRSWCIGNEGTRDYPAYRLCQRYHIMARTGKHRSVQLYVQDGTANCPVLRRIIEERCTGVVWNIGTK